MYHANQPNRRQLAAEAEGRALRARREAEYEARRAADEREDNARRLAHVNRCQKRDEVRAGVGIPLRENVRDKRDAFEAELCARLAIAAPASSVVERVRQYTTWQNEPRGDFDGNDPNPSRSDPVWGVR